LMFALAIAVIAIGNSQSFAATLVVDPDLTMCATAQFGPFQTIQGALSAAQPGDTIFVCPNLASFNPNTPEPYIGPILIQIANLTIIGVASTLDGDSRVLIANASTVIGTAPAGGSSATAESRGIVTLDATGITFGNFTVDGDFFGANTSTTAFNGVVATDDAAGSTIFNTSVLDITNATAAENPAAVPPVAFSNNGNGILVEGGSTATGQGVSVLNNVVSNFRSTGIVVGEVFSGTASAGTARGIVRGNYVLGNNASTTTQGNRAQRGIAFDNGTAGAAGNTTGDIFNNRVAEIFDNSCNGFADRCGAIALNQINGGVTTRFNVLTANVAGIVGTNVSNLTINNNQIFGRGNGILTAEGTFGIIVAGSDNNNGSNFNTIQFNTITFNVAGVLVGFGTDTSAVNNVINNTFQDAFFGILNIGISTNSGTGLTSNTFIQVDNFRFEF